MKIKKLFLVFMCLVTLCSSIPSFAYSTDELTVFDIFFDVDKPSMRERFIWSYYGLSKMKDVKITFKSSTYICGLDNLDQDELNDYYERQTNVYVHGTCTAVAIVNLIWYNKKSVNTEIAFKNLVSQAKTKKYADYQGVIYGNKEKTCLTLCASQNNISKSASEYILNKRARVRNAVKDFTPVILGFLEHSVLAKGVEVWTLSYKNPSTGKTVTKDLEFFYVNEGWGRTNGSLVLSELFSDSTGDAYILK